MSEPRTCLIVNPAAGQKAGLITNPFDVGDASSLLVRHGIRAEIWRTERPGHATELARQAARERYGRVIAAGGDGTVEEVARGLIGTNVELGILPLGSIMNVARMLGIPRDLEAAAHVIAERRVARIDVGRANTQAGSDYFIEAAGVGFDAGVFAYLNQIDRGHWRSLWPLIDFMRRYRSRRVRLSLDGTLLCVRAMMVSVANGPYVGAALAVAPDAQLDDHALDVHVFTRFSEPELLRYLLAIAGGRRVYNPKIMAFQARSITVIPDRPMMVHCDSRPLATTPAHFEVLPSALAVIVGGEACCLTTLRTLPPPQALAEVSPDPPGAGGDIPSVPAASRAQAAGVLNAKPPAPDLPANEPTVGASNS